MKGFFEKFKGKIEEEKKHEKIKGKRNKKKYITDKEIKERLDLQFAFDDDKKNEQIYESFF